MKQDSEAKTLIKYFKSLGIEVYTNTKARGHQGFFLKNRIDVSKNTKEERIVPTLLHEFAHYIHSKLEPDMAKNGGHLEILFNIEDKRARGQEGSQKTNLPSCLPAFLPSFNPSLIEEELLSVTHFVDENSLCHRLFAHKEQIKKRIKSLEEIIKTDYPKFMRSKKFKEFDKYIKKSKAKYLLKYDRVKFVSPSLFGLLKKFEIYTIDSLEKDFPDMPRAFCAYIRLKSAQKKQARNSSRINNLNKYYSKPAELFSRLVEGMYLDPQKTQALAPGATQRFFELLEDGYYCELKHVFEILQKSALLATF